MHPVEIQLPELIARAPEASLLDLSSRRRVHTDLAGIQLSGFRGRGMDFEEFRQYQPGDDVRNIDWRVTARTGEVHTKVFKEERERPVLIAIDQGLSMRFATQRAFKSVLAAHIAALTAWAARQNGDRVGGLVFGTDGHAESRPAGGDRGVLRFLRCMSEAQNHQPVAVTGEELSNTLHRLRKVARPGALLQIISDLGSWNEDCRRQLFLLSQHCEVLLCRVSDPLEKQLPPPGSYQIELADSNGSSTDRRRALDTRSKASREQYESQQWQRRETLIRDVISSKAHIFEASTDQDPLESLKVALGKSETRHARRSLRQPA